MSEKSKEWWTLKVRICCDRLLVSGVLYSPRESEWAADVIRGAGRLVPDWQSLSSSDDDSLSPIVATAEAVVASDFGMADRGLLLIEARRTVDVLRSELDDTRAMSATRAAEIDALKTELDDMRATAAARVSERDEAIRSRDMALENLNRAREAAMERAGQALHAVSEREHELQRRLNEAETENVELRTALGKMHEGVLLGPSEPTTFTAEISGTSIYEIGRNT